MPAQTNRIYWIASYPRSGNTWMRVFIHSLFDEMNGVPPNDNWIADLTRYTTNERRIAFYRPFIRGNLTPNDWQTVAEARPKAQAEIARRATGSIFVKTHLAFTKMGGYPVINAEVTKGAVYLVRNPLDVVCSLAPHYGGSIDGAIDFMETFMWSDPNSEGYVHQVVSSWSHNVESWTTRPRWPVLTLRYEDLLERPHESFRAFVDHAGLKPTDAQFEGALARSNFSDLKRREAATGFTERPPHSSDQFFRVGRSGQWEEVLTGAQVDRIVAAHGTQMRRFGYLPEG